ncbi:shewanella-like protein phosphatase [Pendulispora albinea]|uniref:Shewanella-like protein phosphatase n=1 Tax=Pendulispora albinea TaxID=2741071 RepID=A0ABZ2LPK8_9BACT
MREPESAPETKAASKTPPAASASAPSIPPLSERLSRPAPERLVAIGDLHGDLEKTRRVLRLAGAIDANDAWIGGKLMVVQTGDEIDRGDDDRRILDLIEKLKGDAKKAGGELIALVGNHELMNVGFDFRYVTPGAFKAFTDITASDPNTAAFLAQLDPSARGRAAAFAPGGRYATLLAERPLMIKVGDSIFVHGGILPKHASYGLDRMNDEVRAWLTGKKEKPPQVVVAEDGPVWSRAFSIPGEEKCALLDESLRALGAKRMVMGHTVQKGGVTDACDRKAWRIDVGLSHYYDGPVQALEIKGDTLTPLKESG